MIKLEIICSWLATTTLGSGAFASQHLNPPATMFTNWSELLSWIQGNSWDAPSLLRIGGSIDLISSLETKKQCLAQQPCPTTETIFRFIDKEMWNTITARRDRKQFLKLMAKWMRWTWKLVQLFFIRVATLCFSFFAKV